jgi:mannose-6-phosphate isomerase
MKIHNYGGNLLNNNYKFNKNITLSDTKYKYYFYIIKKDETISINLNYYSIYILRKNNSAKLKVNNKQINIKKDDCINFYNYSKNDVHSVGGTITVLVSGVKKRTQEKTQYEVIKKSKIYTVQKPWGNEKWINGRGKFYAFKKIYLKKNFKTSLQYHNYKMETNLLFNGKANLVYKKNKKVDNKFVQKSDLGIKKINSISSVFVTPKVLHRIHALSNIILFETSTPHLDDVIRVSDDLNRVNGLIKSEHKIKRSK